MKKARYSSARPGTGLTGFMNPASRTLACMIVVCLTFVPLDLLLSLSGAAFANTATNVPETLPQKKPDAVRDPNISLKQQLVKEEIRVIESKEDVEKENTLKQMIEQVRSMQFGQEQKPAASPSMVPAKPPAIDPNAGIPAIQPRLATAKPDVEPKLPAEKVTDQTLQKLKALAEQPGNVGDPLGLGEILFCGGSLEAAARFYGEALKRIDPNDPNASENRPWILFQIGNCLRESDRPAAAKTYAQLLSEYPQSPWTEMGKAESKIIEWYLRDEPQKLMKEPKQPTGK